MLRDSLILTKASGQERGPTDFLHRHMDRKTLAIPLGFLPVSLGYAIGPLGKTQTYRKIDHSYE